MTFTLGMTLTADAKGAKAELAATAGEAKKVTAATTEMGTAAKTAGAGAQVLAAGAQAATVATERLGNAEAAAAGKAVQMGRTHQLAAGQVGNLTAQFNDIGMMLMAGQNPLQLAIQQGTQISQVIGPMGAAGAVRALGGALMGMLNPVSLITMGAIAAGAAMVQWLTSAVDDAEGATDAIKNLATEVSGVDEVLGRIEDYDFDTTLTGMAAQATLVRQEFETILAVVNNVQQIALQEALNKMREQVSLAEQIKAYSYEASIAGQLGTDAPTFDAMGLSSLYEARVVMQSIRDIEGATREEILLSINATSEKLMLQGLLTNEVQQYLATMAEELGLSSQIAEEVKGQVAAHDAVRAAIYDQLVPLAKIPGLIDGAIGRAASLASAFGVAAGKAWDVAAGAAAAAQEWKSWNATPGALRGADDERGSQREGRKDVADLRTQEMLRSNPAFNPSLGRGSRGGNGGGGASAINAERDAMAELIAKEQLELDILRESDPVQKELLRHRDARKNATAAERTKLEELIAARMAEKDAATGAQSAWSMLADGATNALDAILFKSKSAGDAVRELARTILQAAGQAFLSGSGPLAGLFGISGGLFGGGGKSIPLFAGGGQLVGPGTGTSDSILMYGSTGEFMVNAKSTAEHLPLLEAINAGAPLPRFARGGRIGGSGAGSSGDHGEGAGPVEFHIHVNGARGNSEISEMIEQGVGQALTTYDREVVPARFAQISRDPGKVG